MSLMDKAKEIYEDIKKSDIGQIEIYMSESREEELSVRENALDKFIFPKSSGVGLRIIKDGRVGMSFSEKADSVKELLNDALISMRYASPEVKYNVFIENDKVDIGKTYETIDKGLENISINDLKERAFEIEKSLYALDSKIVNVPSAGLSRYRFTKCVINSNGICKEEKKLGIIYFAEVIAKDKDLVKTSYDAYNARNYDFNLQSFTKSIVDDALSKLYSKPIRGGKYKTIFSNDAMRALVSSYLGLFSSESVQKKISLLQDKKGKKIASDIVNILDSPMMENGLGNTNFDGEGASTKEITLVEDGILRGFLYNNYTAKKDNTVTTAHAARGSYKSPVGISCHNFILKEGKYSKEDLIKEIKDGVFVSDITGTHAGVNAISGDFSLQAEGIKVENGSLSYTASPFIVSGNILELLSSIEMIANDTDYCHSSIYTPSVLIKELSFAS